MAKKKSKSKKQSEPPMKLFYLFYTKERWDNWITTLMEMNFDLDPASDEMPEGLQALFQFAEDVTIEVLKIIRLYQNERFTLDETSVKVNDVESIVMEAAPDGDIQDIVGSLQMNLLVLFSGCRKYLAGEFEKDVKALVKKGRALGPDDVEDALEIASHIGASVIDGATCCARYLKDDVDEPTLFEEWLNEIDLMAGAMKTLTKFDEDSGETA